MPIENEGIDLADIGDLLSPAKALVKEIKDVVGVVKANRAPDSPEGKGWSNEEKLAFLKEINEAQVALGELSTAVIAAVED